MKPAVYKISDASFIGHYFKLLVFHLHKFRTAKHVVLIGVVLVCLLARYVILLGDNSQIKIQSVTEKYQKIRVPVPKLIIIPNGTVLHKNNFFKFRQVRFDAVKTDNIYFIANEEQ